MRVKSNKKIRKNSKNPVRFSSFTPRTRNIDPLFSPRPPCRTQSAKNVKNILIKKNSIINSKKAEKSLLSYSEKPIELKNSSNVHTASFKYQKLRPKAAKQTKTLKSSATETVAPKKLRKSKKISNSAPQYLTEKPNLASLKDLIEKITPKFQSEQIDLTKLGKIEKSEFPSNSKSLKQFLPNEDSFKRETKDCAFKPTVSDKPNSSHKKTKSLDVFSLKPKSKLINKKDPPISNTESKPSSIVHFHRKNPASLSEKGTFLSSTLGKMSPGKRPDAKELSEKLQRLSIPSKLK